MTDSPDNNSRRPQVSFDECEQELRISLTLVAQQIAALRGDTALAREFLGVDFSDWQEIDLTSQTVKDIDLRRFPIAAALKRVHSFALQEGDEKERALFHLGIWLETNSFYALAMGLARDSGYDDLLPSRSKMYIIGTMARARLHLKAGQPMNLRDLASLANMEMKEVSDSLIADGLMEEEDAPVAITDEDLITADDLPDDEYLSDEDEDSLEDESLTEEGEACPDNDFWALDPASAEAWLRRRGVPPTLMPEDVGLSHAPEITQLLRTASFGEVMDLMRMIFGYSPQKLADMAGVEVEWLRGLFDGQQAACDITALKRLADCLKLDVPLFVGRAVEAILSATADHVQENSLKCEGSGELNWTGGVVH